MLSLSRTKDAPARQGWSLRLAALGLLALLVLAGCNQTPQPQHANFGDAKNHIHTMATLPGHPGTLLVGTHYGLFRTTDGGTNWKKVLGAAGQPAEGLMDQYLTVSPANPERVYVDAVTFPDLPKSSGVPGIYTSTNGGATWSMAASLASLPAQSLYYLAAGSRDERQVYAYFQQFQDKGLYESTDAGATWHQLGTLPDSESLGLLVDPARPGHLFMYSVSGLFESPDNGSTWQHAPGITNGIQKAVLAGSMLYASGDDGTFVSQDAGAHFTLIPQSATYQFLVSSQKTPATVYGLSGSNLSMSADAGQHWSPVAIPPDRLIAGNLVIDPDSSAALYLGNSYPVAIYSTSTSGQNWSQIAP